MERIQNLVISPHIDDEVLGAFTFLGPKTFVLYLGVEDRTYVSAQERKAELGAVAEKLAFRYEVHDFEVNNYQTNELIGVIETVVNRLQPEFILLPCPSYNQDHRAVYDAAHCAVRPHDKNYFVPNVLIYEQPQSLLWPVRSFMPNFFRPLNIASKIKAYQLYASQVRGHRSPEVLKNMASLRGKQANVPYAEAFEILRMCNR